MKLALLQLQAHNIADHETAFQNILSNLQEACETDADMIVLPECAYPGYLMGAVTDNTWETRVEDLLAAVQKAAADYSKYIAIGVSYPADGKLYNSAFVYNRKGERLYRYDKSNLFHFDRSWFTPGDQFPVFETEFGTVGLMICADARIPEVARALRVAGAKLIVDCVNLVAYAAKPEQLTNQQYAFMLRTRALENGCYIAVANKVGVEENAVTMAGRSCVIAPDGKMI
ncbi:MAG: carbon-nitrogen hydrolase family protein, partial [Oscillospiraceae bacterium]|nr:carbon-nitrogen hydrolase family protein [Oscillospiraceae bacterium]